MNYTCVERDVGGDEFLFEDSSVGVSKFCRSLARRAQQERAGDCWFHLMDAPHEDVPHVTLRTR